MTPPSLLLDYHANGFPRGKGQPQNGLGQLRFTWAALIRAALTVGRRGWRAVRAFGNYSKWEMTYRKGIVYANLRQDPVGHLYQSDAFCALDPSEKGAVSYFLGLTVSKLVSERLLRVPWLLHLDVYWDELDPRLKRGRARPDLAGRGKLGWAIVESKGRTGKAPAKLVVDSKKQAQRITKIAGSPLRHRCAIVSHFIDSKLCAIVDDPNGVDDAIEIETSDSEFLHRYYEPLIDLLLDGGEGVTVVVDHEEFTMRHLGALGVHVGLGKRVLDLLREEKHDDLFASLNAALPERTDWVSDQTPHVVQEWPSDWGPVMDVSVGEDAVIVALGEAWSADRMILEPELREDA